MNNSRALVIIIVFLAVFALLLFKLADLQILKSEELKYFARKQQTRQEKIEPERGLIYDRNNTLLVYNRKDVSFYLDLRMANKTNRRKIADKFSEVFGKSSDHYLELMKKGKGTICIEKKASGDKALMLKNFKADGLFYKEDPTRIYQYDMLAGHLLGYLNHEYKGVAGVERSMEEKLRGAEGYRLVERNAIGDIITVSEEDTRPALPGFNIVLTINKNYQLILEEELKKGVETFGGTSATGIIIDPNSGEILALANTGDFDPNKYWQFSDFIRRDRSITDTYEPGSTFKTITLAALLDQDLCTEDELVFAENGKYKYKNVTISDTKQHDWLTVSGVFEQSSNIGMAKLTQKISNDLFYKYIRAFGFGNFTSYGLPGEAKGYLKKPGEWSGISKTFLSFGYEISVTPLQMALAYSAVINGGLLYKPQLVKKMFRSGINEEVSFKPSEIRRVISKETSARIRNLMIKAVENGTGKNALIEGVKIGGKTGTSQKLIGGNYSKAEHNSSFIGFYPAENPQVLCLILVNAPTIGKYGGLVAAPIFKNVSERIINSDPVRFRPEPENIKTLNDEVSIVKAQNNVENNSGRIDESVLKQNIMPDLKNMSIRDAVIAMASLGITYKITGSGKVISQSIKPGEKIRPGMVCNIVCKEILIKEAAVY